MPEEVTNQNSQSPSFAVPEAYKSEPWVEKIKTSDDLWKTTANLQSVIGKRPAGIPDPNADDAEWDKFYSAAGRPESPDKYKFSEVQGLPEGFDVKPFQEKAGAILHAAGLNNRQADKVWQLFLQAEAGAAVGSKQAQEAKQKELDAEFDKITKETFGDKYDAASKTAQEAILKYVPEQLRGAYTEIADNPKALAAVISALSGMNAEIEKVKKEYGAEGNLTGGGAQTTGQTIEEARKELASLRVSPAAKDFMHVDNKKTMGRIAELEEQVRRNYNKKT